MVWAVLSFMAGIFVGSSVAVLAMALCNIAGRDKREDE